MQAKGITASAFVADAGAPDVIGQAIADARAALGPIEVLHWNAISGAGLGDLLGAGAAAVGAVFNVAVVGFLAAVQEALPDLKAAKGAVLVTNGAFGELSPQIDQLAIRSNAVGVALANAAKHKLVGLLAQRLQSEGVYVGEVMIAGAVKGTPSDAGGPAIDPARIANEFWRLYQARADSRARVS